jgi:chitinase
VYNINAAGYTHLVYSFAKVSENLEMIPWNTSDAAEYLEFNKLKDTYPGLKTMIAIGGWTHNDPGPLQSRFSDVSATEAARKNFASTTVSFLRQYGFDGLDLDWEYPAASDRGGRPEDRQNYVLLCMELKAAFDAAPEKFELTMATPLSPWYSQGFDFIGLSQHVDWFNLM